MALRSALSRYKSIARPKAATGAQSSYFSSLAKKTQAAEDDVVDHNYAVGLLSAEAYLNELSKRMTRPGLTPLQQVNIRQKIESTTESYNDSVMQNNYKAGTVTDRQMYEYEKGKLDKMTAADGAAYQSQAAKVTGLLDKAQKTERKDYRMGEMLRISRLPEDTSERLQAKADLYKKLWDQAVADGDSGDATALETSFNNYNLGAQKAAVTDQVNSIMGQIAENNQNVPYYTDANGMPIQQDGTPAPVAGSGSVGGIASPSPAAGVSTGAGVPSSYSDAVGKAQEAFRIAVIRDKNIQQDIQNTNTRIAALQDAQKKYKAMGAVDQADAVATQIQNLKNRLSDLNDSRAGNAQNIAEIQTRIGEASKAAAYQETFGKLQDNENIILDAEQNLDLMLQSGKISKEEYLTSKREVIAQKVELYKEYGNTYSLYDKTNPAADMVRKAQREEMANLRTIDVQKNNPGRFELVENADGKIELTDVYSQKVAKTFGVSYLKDGDIYRRVYVPGATDENGNPMGLSSSTAKALAIQNDLNGQDSMFVTKVVDGQLVEIPVTLVDGKPFYKQDVQKLLQTGKVQADPKVGYKSIQAAGPSAAKMMTDIFAGNVKKAKDVATSIAGAVPGATKSILTATSPAYRQSQGLNPSEFVGIDVPDLKKIFGSASDSVMKLLQNVKTSPQGEAVQKTINQSPLESAGFKGANISNILESIKGGVGNMIQKLIPKVEAKGIQFEKPKVAQSGFPVAKTWDEMVKQATQIAYEYGIPPQVMIAQMALESGRGTSNRAQKNQLFGVGVYNDNSPGFQYGTPEASMRGYADLITKDPRYATAMKYKNDPAQMIRAIKAAGYAADPNYVAKILAMPEFRADYSKYKPAPAATVVSDYTDIVPPDQGNWYDSVVNGVKQLFPQVRAAEPTGSQSSVRSQTPTISPAVQAIKPSIASPSFTPSLAQTSGSSAQLKAPAPAIKLPSIPSYNPVQTFQSNVQKATGAVQNVAKAVGNTVSNVANTVKNTLSKLKFW